MSEDLHSPTAAAPPPPPVDGPSHAAGAHGGLGGAPDGPPAAERPEVQAGLAFAGGLLAAMVLRRITR